MEHSESRRHHLLVCATVAALFANEYRLWCTLKFQILLVTRLPTLTHTYNMGGDGGSGGGAFSNIMSGTVAGVAQVVAGASEFQLWWQQFSWFCNCTMAKTASSGHAQLRRLLLLSSAALAGGAWLC
jgi:hypothetical protein